MLNILSEISWNDLLDMIIVYYLIYKTLLFIRGTRSIQMAMGIGVVVLAFALSYALRLYTLQLILRSLFEVFIIMIIIIFAEDIRKALSSVGQNPFLKTLNTLQSSKMIDEITKALVNLANKKVGALIVIERNIGLKNYLEIGTVIESRISSALLFSIFTSKESHIHDGAIIIQAGRITAAGCFLPLTLRPEVPKELGTRHRAALGISEETDAVAIVVSEEKGHISLVMGGKMIRDLTGPQLRKMLAQLLSVNTRGTNLYEIFDSIKEVKETA